MGAYLVASFTVTDPLWMADYMATVPSIARRYGAEFRIVANDVKRLEGQGGTPDAIGIIEFPSMEAIESFLADADYKPLRAARQAGSNGNLFAIAARD